jgi:hypothetical protein
VIDIVQVGAGSIVRDVKRLRDVSLKRHVSTSNEAFLPIATPYDPPDSLKGVSHSLRMFYGKVVDGNAMNGAQSGRENTMASKKPCASFDHTNAEKRNAPNELRSKKDFLCK